MSGKDDYQQHQEKKRKGGDWGTVGDRQHSLLVPPLFVRRRIIIAEVEIHKER